MVFTMKECEYRIFLTTTYNMHERIDKLLDRIIQRININLRELDYDVSPFIKNLVPLNQMVKFYAFYGITPNHPLDLVFRHSSLAGSYFLGKIRTRNSILYKSDIRGDELKHQGDVFHYQKFEIPITRDEGIDIEDSFLIKTLVHNFSHDPETLEKFFIRDTVSVHEGNIHGSPCDGMFSGTVCDRRPDNHARLCHRNLFIRPGR